LFSFLLLFIIIMLFQSYPKTNDIGINKQWKRQKNRCDFLILLQGLHEIGHLLTRPFLQQLDPNTESVD